MTESEAGVDSWRLPRSLVLIPPVTIGDTADMKSKPGFCSVPRYDAAFGYVNFAPSARARVDLVRLYAQSEDPGIQARCLDLIDRCRGTDSLDSLTDFFGSIVELGQNAFESVERKPFSDHHMQTYWSQNSLVARRLTRRPLTATAARRARSRTGPG